jgi:hypothetical protein
MLIQYTLFFVYSRCPGQSVENEPEATLTGDHGIGYNSLILHCLYPNQGGARRQAATVVRPRPAEPETRSGRELSAIALSFMM